MNKLRIVFLGTPEFAAHCLDQLIKDGFNIVGVVTSPDRKKGRGQKVSFSPVKEIALKNELPIYQPSNLKDDEFKNELMQLSLDIGVVVAFRMLPVSIWNLPKMGTINLHASLLPNYRGAAPINWVLINGEKKTGITTFFLKHEIDTGDVIQQKEIEIDNNINAGELHDVLMNAGGHLISESLKNIEKDNFSLSKQNDLSKSIIKLKQAPKIYRETCEINWNQSSSRVHDFIRGLSPYPGAWSTLLTKSGKELIFKVYRTMLTEMPCNNPNELKIDSSGNLLVGTTDTFIKILRIQLEGKKKMDSNEFIKGFPIKETSIKKS